MVLHKNREHLYEAYHVARLEDKDELACDEFVADLRHPGDEHGIEKGVPDQTIPTRPSHTSVVR